MIPDFLWDFVPTSLKSKVAASAINSLVRSRDFTAHDWLGIPALERSMSQLAKSGWNPRQFVDVGAFEGTWTQCLLDFFPEARYLMIEAQPGKCEILKRKFLLQEKCQVLNSLVGKNVVNEVKFNLAESGSSLLEDKNPNVSQAIYLPMTTLDALLSESKITGVDLLKLDVQGAEFQVLEGAEACLRSTEFVLLELSFQELYESAPLAASVIRFMTEKGFQLYDICSMMRRPKDQALAQIDALFVKSGSIFSGKPGWL